MAKPKSKPAVKLDQPALKMTLPIAASPDAAFPLLTYEALAAHVERGKAGEHYVFPACLHGEEVIEPIMLLNTDNRPFRDHICARYMLMMESGMWINRTAQTISFNNLGILDNGQHRLVAALRTGYPFCVFIAVGNDPKAWPTIDNNQLRSRADILRHYKNPHLLGAAGEMVWRWRQGKLSQERRRNNPVEIEKIIIENPGLVTATDWTAAHKKRFRGMMVPSALGFLRYALSEARPTKADEFFDLLMTGANMPANHPVLRLRDLLKDKGRGAHRPDLTETLARCIIAWNAFTLGKTPLSVDWERTSGRRTAAGFTPRPFPVIL